MSAPVMPTRICRATATQTSADVNLLTTGLLGMVRGQLISAQHGKALIKFASRIITISTRTILQTHLRSLSNLVTQGNMLVGAGVIVAPLESIQAVVVQAAHNVQQDDIKAAQG